MASVMSEFPVTNINKLCQVHNHLASPTQNVISKAYISPSLLYIMQKREDNVKYNDIRTRKMYPFTILILIREA
jgi:hypothetical protein